MPRRKQKNRQRVISYSVIEQLREAVKAGVPWTYRHAFGRLDLYALVKGHYYDFLCDMWKDEADTETPALLWQALRDDILAEHIRRRPLTRPWAWWRYDAPEPRPDDEDEWSYLERLKLLATTEKEIVEKYGDIEFVRVSSGAFGECGPCWVAAREIAKRIGFELKTPDRPCDVFWVPDQLVFDCAHRKWSRQGIFTIEDF